MVICGVGPNLKPELAGSKCQTGFPAPDRFDHAPIQVVDFSHLLASPGCPRQFPFTPPLPELGLDNLPASSAWPILSEPSCSPVRSPPACAASSRASAKATILVLAVCDPPNSGAPLPRCEKASKDDPVDTGFKPLKYILFFAECSDHTGVAHDPMDVPIFLSISNCCGGSQRGHCSEPVHSDCKPCSSKLSRRGIPSPKCGTIVACTPKPA